MVIGRNRRWYENSSSISGAVLIQRFLTEADVNHFISVTLEFHRHRESADAKLSRTWGHGPFKILVLETWAEASELQAQDMWKHGFKVVIAAPSIQGSEQYTNRIREYTSCDHAEGRATGLTRTNKVMENFHKKVEIEIQRSSAERFVEAASNHLPPVFQMFWWHRVVFDEFHESESWVFRTRELLKSIGATHRWGLSGTPPLGSTEPAAQVAELLCYDQGTALQEYIRTKNFNTAKRKAVV